MKPVCLLLPLSLVAALGSHRAEAVCYERTLSGWELAKPRVAASADGRMVVLWSDEFDYATGMSADGAPDTTRQLPPVNNWRMDNNTALASGPDSHLLVAAPFGLEIRTLALGAEGEPRTAAWNKLAVVPYGQYGMVPDVLWDDDSFALAWTIELSQAEAPFQKYWQMRVARVDADGVLRGIIVDVPGATADEWPRVRIVRTGSVLWLLWSAGYDDETGFLRGMRLAPDLTALDLEPVHIHDDGKLRDVAGQGDRALLLAEGDQAGTDLLALIDEDGVVSVEPVTTLLDPSDGYVELFATPVGGYQLLETSHYWDEPFPRAAASYQVLDLDASGHVLDQAPIDLFGSTPAGTASHRGTVLVWAQDEGTPDIGASRILLRMPDGQAVLVFEKALFIVATEVPCPPPPSTGDGGSGSACDHWACPNSSCSAGGPAGMGAVGILLVAAVIAGRRRRRR